MSLAAAQTESPAPGRIPVLDIGAYLAGEAGAAVPLARAIARTCEDTGFLVVANHGVPPQLVDDTFAVAQQFFARPEGDKLALKVGKYNIGYLAFGGQVVRHSPVNKNTKPNFSESFYITRDRAPDHPDIVNNKPLVGLNRWPEDMPEFRDATTAYYRAMEAMTTRLVPLFALALDLPADYFAAAFAEPNCTIRLIHYPPHPSPEDNEFGFAPHTDNNFITLLAQSKLPGLEVRTAEGDWIRPPAVPGTFVVNTGALLERPISGDASPRDQSQRSLALRLPVLPRAEPRCGRRTGPKLRRRRQPAQIRADHLRRLYPAPADAQLRPPPSRGQRRVRGVRLGALSRLPL
jgi:isopenicillin N synthase-like dioxygenase